MFATVAMFILPITPILAQNTNEYAVLAPLPGTTNSTCDVANPTDAACKTTLEKYLPGLFNLAIGLSAAFAVLMIVIGGFEYMSTDALQKKEDGKKRIENSIYGLLLVIGAWLILFTINPTLLTLRLGIDSVEIPPPAGGAGGTLTTGGIPMTQAEKDASNAIKGLLASQGIVTYTGPCTFGQTSQCVNLNGLTDTTLSGLVTLKNSSGSNVTITGGTEAGHSTTGGHPTGDSVDLRFDTGLDAYVISNGGTPQPTNLGLKYTVNINGRNVTFLKEADHWHATFQ